MVCGSLIILNFGIDKTYLFNNKQIDKVYFIGYQDKEQLEFKIEIEKILEKVRKV